MTELLSFGELLVDLEPDALELTDGSRAVLYLGGSAANMAVTYRLLGGDSILVSAVGDDILGSMLLEALKRYGMPIDHILIKPVPTTLVLTHWDIGERFVVYWGAHTMIGVEEFPEGLLEDADVFHTSAFMLARPPSSTTAAHLFKKALELSKIVSIDTNFRDKLYEDPGSWRRRLLDMIEKADYVKISEDDARTLFRGMGEGELMVRLRDHPGTVVYTMSRRGALIFDKGSEYRIEVGGPRRRGNTVGAGDVFYGSFLYYVRRGLHPKEAGRKAAALASLKLKYGYRVPVALARVNR